MALQLGTVSRSIAEIEELYALKENCRQPFDTPVLPGHIQVDFEAKGADGNFSAPDATSPRSVALFSTNHVTVTQPSPPPARVRAQERPRQVPECPKARPAFPLAPNQFVPETDCTREGHQSPRSPMSPARRERENRAMKKYWKQRYSLFALFDLGIELDRVSWYSVTPEKIASHIARRFAASGARIIVDAFAGAAGNTIAFARECGGHTLAIELCQNRIALARRNARVYGVEGSIDFVNGDAYALLPSIRCVDAVFLSPPWGGPLYQDGGFRIGVFREIVAIARKVTRNVAILVPKNISRREAFETFGPCEIEENFLEGRPKTVTIYFGGLVRSHGVTRSEEFDYD